MTTIQVKNEAQFLANSHKTKEEMFNKMCSSILSIYNRLSGENIHFEYIAHYGKDAKSETTLQRLMSKLSHMAFGIGSPQSIEGLLTRIATKPVKMQSQPEYKEQPKLYGTGHFRWDWQAYTLNENELKAIQIYLGLHVEKKAVTPRKTKEQYILYIDKFNNIENYQEKADYLLIGTNTTFTTEFKEHSFYFDGDKERRDIYICVLKNKNARFRFTFGQSINNTDKAPTAYDVLASLTKYDPGTFENFCGEYGYEEDSRSAYKTYKAVMKEWKNIELLFTPEQIELLQEIQ